MDLTSIVWSRGDCQISYESQKYFQWIRHDLKQEGFIYYDFRFKKWVFEAYGMNNQQLLEKGYSSDISCHTLLPPDSYMFGKFPSINIDILEFNSQYKDRLKFWKNEYHSKISEKSKKITFYFFLIGKKFFLPTEIIEYILSFLYVVLINL